MLVHVGLVLSPVSLPLATLLLSPVVPLSSRASLLPCLICCTLCQVFSESHWFPSLPFSNTWPLLSRPFSPFSALSFLSPRLSVCLTSCIISLSPHLPVLGPHPFFTSPVCPHHPLCLPQLSGKAAVIYELWTGPAAGAGGPDYGFPEEAACLGWQGDSVYRAAPAQSAPVSPRRMECWRRPVTSFTPPRANNKTLTHGLDTGSGLPKNIPSQAQGPELG